MDNKKSNRKMGKIIKNWNIKKWKGVNKNKERK
jgi:hypothetical protein